MITVLKATTLQKNTLHGYSHGVSRLEFIQDANGNWVTGKGILSNPDFAGILPQLEALVEIPYSKVAVEEDPEAQDADPV